MTDPDEPSTMSHVNPVTLPGTPPAPLADPARADALRAARASHVDVRETLALTELTAITALYDEIWRPATNPPISTELLRALSKAGNYVAGAFDGTRLLGACVGFFAAPVHSALHSHIAGVSASVAGRHVGYALKLHQRAWALGNGVPLIEWTFDPLVARNAYFNIVKLGGLPAEYLPNFYGDMDDGINGDDDTDRLLLRWELSAQRVVSACAGAPRPADVAALKARGAAVGLYRGERGEPVLGSADAQTVLVAVPRDVETLRLADPGQAKEWRIAVREVLGGLFGAGARVTGFDRDGWYVIQR